MEAEAEGALKSACIFLLLQTLQAWTAKCPSKNGHSPNFQVGEWHGATTGGGL